jgi:hypothetical protein
MYSPKVWLRGGLLATALALVPPVLAQVTEVTTCGTLTQPGTYSVRITGATGGDCVVIDGPNINLGSVSASFVDGSGTGAAVRFTSRATNGSMSTSAEWGISGFNTGVEIDGDGVNLEFNYSDNMVISNATTGILINNASNVEINGFRGELAAGIGISADKTGVLVAGRSSHDTITGTENPNGQKTPQVGIRVNRSASSITVESNSTQGEMVDKHRKCRTDTWQNNTFVSANQSCIH